MRAKSVMLVQHGLCTKENYNLNLKPKACKALIAA